MPSGSTRYPGYPAHLQRTGMPPEGYPPGTDSSGAKELSRDGGKSRGGLPKHLQDQYGPTSKSDPKLSSPSPGGMYPGSYPPASGRPPHLLPPQSDNPPGRGDSGTPSREKTQNKALSVQEQELRALGKTTMTAANFINAIIMRQISCETAMPETGSVVASSSTSDGKMLWILGSSHHLDPPPSVCGLLHAVVVGIIKSVQFIYIYILFFFNAMLFCFFPLFYRTLKMYFS